jgi:hypothetical protein
MIGQIITAAGIGASCLSFVLAANAPKRKHRTCCSNGLRIRGPPPLDLNHVPPADSAATNDPMKGRERG